MEKFSLLNDRMQFFDTTNSNVARAPQSFIYTHKNETNSRTNSAN